MPIPAPITVARKGNPDEPVPRYIEGWSNHVGKSMGVGGGGVGGVFPGVWLPKVQWILISPKN